MHNPSPPYILGSPQNTPGRIPGGEYFWKDTKQKPSRTFSSYSGRSGLTQESSRSPRGVAMCASNRGDSPEGERICTDTRPVTTQRCQKPGEAFRFGSVEPKLFQGDPLGLQLCCRMKHPGFPLYKRGGLLLRGGREPSWGDGDAPVQAPPGHGVPPHRDTPRLSCRASRISGVRATQVAR